MENTPAADATRDPATGRLKKGHHAGGRPKGRKDTKPRLTISLRNAMQVFLDEDGNLVADRLRQALQDPDGRVGVAAVRVALEYHVKTGGTAKQGKGLVIVLSSNKDPLAEKSGRPGPAIDLTLGNGVVDAVPPRPAPTMAALPPATAATTASRRRERQSGLEPPATAPQKATPERVAGVIENARRDDAKFWRGDCVVCGTHDTLTWTGDTDGRAADFDCSSSHGCTPARIVDAINTRIRAAALALARRPSATPKLPRALQDKNGDDLELQVEPKWIPEMPGDDA